MTLKYYAADDHCEQKALSQFRALEERFETLEDCCRAKFQSNVSECCAAGDSECSLSGNLKFIPVSSLKIMLGIENAILRSDKASFFHPDAQKWKERICYSKDENLLSNWETAFAKDTLIECCEHNIHYEVGSCCENSEGRC